MNIHWTCKWCKYLNIYYDLYCDKCKKIMNTSPEYPRGLHESTISPEFYDELLGQGRR